MTSVRAAGWDGAARAPRQRRWTVWLAVFAIASVLATDLVGFGVLHLRYRILDATSSASWSHVLSAGILAAGTAVCLMGAWRLPRERATWLATGAILALFFVDEATELHARIDSLGYGQLLYLPVLLIFVVGLWRLTVGTAQFGSLQAGAVLLLASYLLHVFDPHIANKFEWTVGSWEYQFKISLKEGLELAGLLLALLALWGAALARRPRSAASAWRPAAEGADAHVT